MSKVLRSAREKVIDPSVEVDVAVEKSLRMRRKPTQERALQTMDAVLRAASTEIESGGLDKLTTKRIAAAAGLSVGGLYEYFPNKEAIVFALMTRWLEQVFAALDSVHPRHGGGLDVLGYLNAQMESVIPLYEAHPALSALFDMLPAMPSLQVVSDKHDSAVLQSVLSALSFYFPKADPIELTTASRSILVICHELLTVAVSDKKKYRKYFMKYLQVCLMGIATRLATA